MICRLKDNHPFTIKVRKLEDLCRELDISISCNYQQQIVLNDNKSGETYEYRDVEQSFSGYDTTTEFPYFAETKLIFEKVDN